MTDIEQLIRSEIYKALESLGGPPELLAATINGASKAEIYDAAERLGADRYLLAAIGSYRQTLSDDEVLEELRRWNAARWQRRPPHLRQT
jgi:hypothetical protein